MTIPVSGLNLGSLLGLGKSNGGANPGGLPFENLQPSVNPGENPALLLDPELVEQLQALLPEGYLEALSNLQQPIEAGNLLPIEVADFAAHPGEGGAPSFKESFAHLLAYLHQFSQQSNAQVATGSGVPVVNDAAISPAPGSAPTITLPTMREWLLKLESSLQTGAARVESSVQLNTNILDDAEALPGVREWLQRLQYALQRNPGVVGHGTSSNSMTTEEVELPPGFLSAKLPSQPSTNHLLHPSTHGLVDKSPQQPSALPPEQLFTQLLNKPRMGSEKVVPAVQGQGVAALSSLLTPASQGGLVAASQVATASPPPMTLAPSDKGWDGMLGNRIMWVVGKQLQSASLKITPPNLGPIEIRVAVHNDQASVSFTAQHGVIREAIESAIPRLREMFNENNLQLVNVDVGQKGSGEQRTLHDFFQQARQDLNQNDELVDRSGDELSQFADDPVQVSVQVHDGLLDDYA